MGTALGMFGQIPKMRRSPSRQEATISLTDGAVAAALGFQAWRQSTRRVCQYCSVHMKCEAWQLGGMRPSATALLSEGECRGCEHWCPLCEVLCSSQRDRTRGAHTCLDAGAQLERKATICV